MSNRIVRFGGASIGTKTQVKNLIDWLNGQNGRKLIVVSAIPELLALVENTFSHIFKNQLNADALSQKINSFYENSIGEEPSQEYLELSLQLINLFKGISLIGDYSVGLKDQVLTFSEKLSVVILHRQFELLEYHPSILWPENIGLKVSADFGSASILSVDKVKIASLPELSFIIPGSYGITSSGKIARTGKTAADYTAAAITAYLNAEKLELWGLDNHFLKADPAIVPNPPVIDRLTYAEASELAYFDHYSFHPRTVEPLEQKHIPIHVLSTESAAGDVETIINTETYVDERIVKSVACSDDISLLKLNGPGVGLKPGILAKVTTCLNDAEINIKSVITAQTSINLILERNTGERALKLIQKLGFNSVQEIKLESDVSLIGIIGHGMQQNYGVSARIFGAAAQSKINVVLSGSGVSDLVSYLIVKSVDKEKSVSEIYNAFFN